MAAKQWAVHVACDNGADTFGFKTKKAAEGFRNHVAKKSGFVAISQVIPWMPGTDYWVIHARMLDGTMKSFGFEDRIGAMLFHHALMNVEVVDCVSFPTKSELER